MGQVIFIIWRESVEALLVVGILYNWLSRASGASSRQRWPLHARAARPRFFRATEVLLLLLAASLVVTGVGQLQALEWLPPLVDGPWDSAWQLSGMGRVGGLVAAFTRYRAQPSLMTVLAWLAFWILMAWLMRRSRARTSCPTAQPGRA
jgi:high-affinity Fe2+/Pb2+ permease